MTKFSDIELELTTMTHGGRALGRHNGRAIFVPYAIPGERITAHITQDKGRFANAEVIEILEPSSARLTPRCKHFAHCGGCHWQHIDYARQLEFKREIVADQLRRIGGFHDVTILPTIPSPQPWNYRTHVTFHVTPAGQPGFVATDNRTVIPIEECHILRPELWALVEQIGEGKRLPTTRLRLQVGSEGDSLRAVSNVSRPGSTNEDDDLGWNALAGSTVYYTVRGRRFRVTAGSFFQVNLPQAETLVTLVLERLSLHGTERVLDLYSGVGLFTRFLAEHAAHITAIENYAPAVRDAETNLADCANVRLIESTAAAGLTRLDGTYDAAVIDPPRAGMEREALDTLLKHAPAHIVYVSCDPATLARDASLIAAAGYTLSDVQPVDMFPQTYHIETVAAFRH